MATDTTPQVDLGSLSDDDLMAEWSTLGEQVAADSERLKAFSQEHQRRTTQAYLANRLGEMSEPERLALAQYAETVGVVSDEAVQTGDEG